MVSKQYKQSIPDSFFRVSAAIVEGELDFSSTVTMINEVELSKIEEFRSKQVDQKRFSYTVFLAKAISIALMEFPEVNKRFYKPFGFFPRIFQKFSNVDIGIASELKDPKLAHVAYIGVMTNVEEKSLDEIQTWLLDFRDTKSVEQWKIFSGIVQNFPYFLSKIIIRMPIFFPNLWVKYRGGVCVISSPAKYGVDSIVASWSSPIGVSFGFVKERAIVKEGRVVIAPTFNLTVNFDRRIISGAQGAKFVKKVTDLLENFEFGSENKF